MLNEIDGFLAQFIYFDWRKPKKNKETPTRKKTAHYNKQTKEK